MRENITIYRLRELLDYNPATGDFYWLEKRCNSHFAGLKAGTKTSNGYVQISVDSIGYRAHRLAWFHFYGAWPKDQIDHINRKRNDNRIANLREATASENQQNRPLESSGLSGLSGVTWEADRQKWRVRIKVKNIIHNIGRYDCLDKAKAVLAEAKARLHLFAPTSGAK